MYSYCIFTAQKKVPAPRGDLMLIPKKTFQPTELRQPGRMAIEISQLLCLNGAFLCKLRVMPDTVI